MSLNTSGLNQTLTESGLLINISSSHPLIKLANHLSWQELSELVLADLQNSTTKNCWWRGRPLQLRTHLGVYIL